nr:nitroreductase family protein [Variibacter gotjawalensis]
MQNALKQRFGEDFAVDPEISGLSDLARMASRKVTRRYAAKPVSDEMLRLLCGCALSAPSKSDLQQGDILIVRDRTIHDAIADMLPSMPWVRNAPVFVVFLANGRRLPQISGWREKPFPNDHLDAFFNASVDAAIVMTSFIRAAEAAGLGCCPISVLRDRVFDVAKLLSLPERVVPIAGLTLGWPEGESHMSARLPLSATVHIDRFDDANVKEHVDAYDRRRAAIHAPKPRQPERWGVPDLYGWSEDKARQYADPQRADFGAFVRAQGFCLD